MADLLSSSHLICRLYQCSTSIHLRPYILDSYTSIQPHPAQLPLTPPTLPNVLCSILSRCARLRSGLNSNAASQHSRSLNLSSVCSVRSLSSYPRIVCLCVWSVSGLQLVCSRGLFTVRNNRSLGTAQHHRHTPPHKGPGYD